MKSTAGVSEGLVFPAWRQFVWAGILSVILASTQGMAQTPGQRLPMVRGGLLFEHPLEAVAESPAAAQEASVLRTTVNSVTLNNMEEVVAALEAFAAENPASVWTPSLRANLGRHYCTEGHWTKALEQWERAWDNTKQYKTGAGKRVADYTLALWTRLLVELGRLDELQVIFADAEGRRLDGGPLTQKYLRTKEMYGILRHRPEAAYRCGWLALNQLALATRGQRLDPRNVREIYQERNLLQSCSMSVVAKMALKEHWSIAGVERPEGSQDLPIPTVMHLKQGHYIALLRADGGFVWAYDPLFGLRHFRRDVLNAESSGRFLVDAGVIPAGWRALSADEMATTVGRSGGIFCLKDSEEGDCDSCHCPGSPPPPPPSPPPPPPPGGGGWGGSSGGDGGSGSSCGGCGGHESPAGMPQWRVTEPNINLWLRDQPISCQPAYGPAVALDLQFKQRDEQERDAHVFSFGPSWNSHWHSHIDWSDRSVYAEADVYLPGGGLLRFYLSQGQAVMINYYYNCQLTVTRENGEAIAFALDFPDGREYLYDRVWNSSHFYMSRSVDQQGFLTRYNYEEVQDANWGTMLRLNTVADQEGDTIYSLQYTNGTQYSSLVSVVTDRFGRSASLSYTEDQNGYSHLSRIEDAVGLPSTVSYDGNGWPQTLATPYGSTTFEYEDQQGDYGYYRRVRITEPNGGSQAYLFSSSCAELWSGSPWMPSEIPASLMPDANSLPQGTMIDTSLQVLNSFHWNQGQNTGVPTDLSQITTNQMNKARMRHWLMSTSGEYYGPDFALSSEVAPSQNEDGSTLGQITFYDYAGKTDTGGSGTQIQPSLMARRLPDGSTWYRAYGRNSFGLASSETSTYGTASPASTRTYTYSYAANDQDVVERRGPSNELLATYGYNGRHQMTEEVLWPDSSTSYTNTWTFDQQGRLQSKTTAAGQTTTYTYNGSSGSYSGYLSSTSEEPVERTESFTWLNGMIRAYTDARGLALTNFWDGLNRLTGRLYPDGTTTTNLYSHGTPYPNGTGGLDILELTASKDRLGHWTTFDYDALRRITAKTNANGVVTRYGYCDCGSASYITNAWGAPVEQVTILAFDNQGNRIAASYADGYSVTNWFNALGQTTMNADGTGYRWYFYNNQGLRTTVSNACGLENAVTFDINDRPEYTTDANGVTVANAHDNLGRLLARAYPDNGVEGFGYSARGLVAYTNQLGFVTRYAYDEASRKTFETNANTETLRYTNSAAGDLLSLTDGKNQTTRWRYDEYGRVTNKLDQAGVEILRYKYDAESRLTNRWSAAKGNTGYAYDFVGNLTNINYPASTDVTLQYDWLNRLTNMVDAAGTTKYTYTAANQLLTEDGPFTSDTVTNTYQNRLRVALGLQQPTGAWTNGFTYDAASRLTNVTSQAGSFGNVYAAGVGGSSGFASRLLQRQILPNGSIITNNYDSVARILGTYLRTSAGVLTNKHEYLYNVASQRTNETRMDSSAVAYAHDNIGQLKVANSSVYAENRGYAYDPAWNMTNRSNNGSATSYGVNGLNEVTNVVGGYSLSYDANGNRTNFGGYYNYSYDDENRLTQMSDDVYHSFRTQFVYDGLGRLRKRLEYVWGGAQSQAGMGPLASGRWSVSVVVCYLYDGWRVIQERDVNNAPTVSYTRGNDLSGSLEGAGGIGGLLARSHGYSGGNWSTHNVYHADGNGNATFMLNSSQTMVARYRYDPFGNTISSSGTLAAANTYRFSSKEVHVSSGMYYYGYRFYDPSLQRWLNRDPIGEDGGINLSVFANNDAIDFFDLDGCAAAKPGEPADPCAEAKKHWHRALHDAELACGGALVCIGGGPIDIVPIGLCAWAEIRAIQYRLEYQDCLNKHKPQPKPPAPKPTPPQHPPIKDPPPAGPKYPPGWPKH